MIRRYATLILLLSDYAAFFTIIAATRHAIFIDYAARASLLRFPRSFSADAAELSALTHTIISSSLSRRQLSSLAMIAAADISDAADAAFAAAGLFSTARPLMPPSPIIAILIFSSPSSAISRYAASIIRHFASTPSFQEADVSSSFYAMLIATEPPCRLAAEISIERHIFS
jgi:hypothetical protein